MALVGEKNIKMLQEVLKFPKLLSKGLESVQNFGLPSTKKEIIHVGMGASALVGNYLKAYFTGEPSIKFSVMNTPNFGIDPNALFIVYSYSGETKETLKSFRKILNYKEDLNIIVASSGGRLTEISKRKDLPLVKLPPGLESRSHLPFGLSAFSYLLGEMYETTTEVVSELEVAIETIKTTKERILSNNARELKEIAKALEASFPFIVGDNKLSPVLLRFVNQLAENAKHLASSIVLPERAHNLICPLKRSRIPVSLLFLKRTSIDTFTKSITKKFREILQNRKSFQIQIDDKKFSLKTLLYPTFIIDLLSVLIADEKGENSHDIREIEEVKKGYPQ